MEYEFIPITYPNPPNDTSVPPPLPTTFQQTTSEVVPGQGLPFIASAPYVAPEPVVEPTPLPQNGVIIDYAETLTYHPLTALPETTFNQTDNYSLPALITTMAGDQSLYAPYTGGNAQSDTWSLYPALQDVAMNGFGMTGMGNVAFAPNKSITNVKIIAISDGGFGSLTLDSDGIQNAGIITGIDLLQLNTQNLTALPNALLLNGVPIATISSLPNIYQWADYPALNNILMNASGTSGPYGISGCAQYGFSSGTILGAALNTPATTSRIFVRDPSNPLVERIIYSGDTSGGYQALGTYTGVPKWSLYSPQNNVDWAQREITNINKITFNTALPGGGGASINALNDLNFSLATGLAGLAGINGPNNIAFWNPDFPGIPGAYINLYSKQLSYNGGPNSAYLASDTKMSIPALYLNGPLGQAGGKLEVLGPIAQTATINGQPCSASWSRYPALEAVQMQFQQMLNVAEIQFANNIGGPFNLLTINGGGFLVAEGRLVVTSPASANIDLNGFNITNVGTSIGFQNDPGNLLTTNGTTLEWRGQPVATGAIGNVADWANYTAVNDVNIPEAYALNINQTNNLFYYKNSHLNTNIYHGQQGGGFLASAPDFISYPTYFQVGSTIFPAREFSVVAGLEGLGLNSLTEVNIDAVGLIFINTVGAVEIGAGAGITLNPVGELLMTAGNITATSATTIDANALGAVEIGAGGLISLTAAGDLNFTSTGATWNVGGLLFDAGATILNWGGTTINTGIATWNSPSSISIAAPNVNFAGAVNTFNSGTLLVNTLTAMAINSPALQINSATTVVAAGRPISVDILEPTTANSLTISGANTITGRTDTGMTVNEVASVNGHGSGMNLTNIDNFENYSATNVLLQNQQFYQTIPTITLNTNNATLAFTSTTKVWQYPNIPQLMFAIQITGKVVNVLGSSQPPGAPVNIAGYVALNNLTNPAVIPLILPFGGLTIVRSVQPTNIAQSYFNILYTTPYVNSGSPMANGNSYQFQVYLTNFQTNPATDAITVSDAGVQVNVQIAQSL